MHVKKLILYTNYFLKFNLIYKDRIPILVLRYCYSQIKASLNKLKKENKMPKSQKIHIDSPKPNTPRTPDIEYNNTSPTAKFFNSNVLDSETAHRHQLITKVIELDSKQNKLDKIDGEVFNSIFSFKRYSAASKSGNLNNIKPEFQLIN